MDRQGYVLTRKANGDARTVDEIGAEYDSYVAALAPTPDPAVLAAAVDRSQAVNAWLARQQPAEDATEAELAAWDDLRRLPFEEQAARAGL